MVERNLGQTMIYWVGEVVDVNDIYQSGRVKVRVYGRHDDRTNIPDSALPWATVTQPVTSAAIGRVGASPVGLVVGSRVIGFWCDGNDLQFPMIIGTLGRAGDPVPGQIVNGGQLIDAKTGGSTPSAAQGADNNQRSSTNSNRPDAGTAEVSVERTSGVSVITEAQKAGAIAALPTVASASKDNTSDVLDIKRAVDPLGTLSSLPCLNGSLISVNSIFNFLGNTVQGIVSGIVRTAVSAIRNAILSLANKIGLFKLVGMLNKAVSGVKAIQDLIKSLNISVCGINPINQGLFKAADFTIASVIGGLNNVIGSITGGIDKVINLTTGVVTAAGNAVTGSVNSGINTILNSVPTVPLAAVATATSPRPATTSILQTPPDNYIQQYYTTENDPYPGYIEWNDPATGLSVYTLRNGQPNYTNAQEHTSFAAQNHFTNAIGNTLLSGGSLSFNALSQAVSSNINFTQTFGLSRILGAGFGGGNKIAALAGLIPTIAGGLQSIFQTNIKRAKLISSQASADIDEFAQDQAIAARQDESLSAGVIGRASQASGGNNTAPTESAAPAAPAAAPAAATPTTDSQSEYRRIVDNYQLSVAREGGWRRTTGDIDNYMRTEHPALYEANRAQNNLAETNIVRAQYGLAPLTRPAR